VQKHLGVEQIPHDHKIILKAQQQTRKSKTWSSVLKVMEAKLVHTELQSTASGNILMTAFFY
jgi:hypothetical protein